MWLGLISAGVGAALTVGGCTRVTSAWSVLTAKQVSPAGPAEPADTTDVETTAPPVAQGEDDLPDNSTAETSVAAANAAAAIAEVYPSAPPVETIKVPVVNIFGEIDGQQAKTRADGGDFGFQQHTSADEGYDADVNIDPTGKWLVYASTRHNARPEIYLQRVDGTSVTQLTSDPSENAQPCFSPDGKTVAFCSTRAGSWDLYTMDIDGRNVVQITSGPSQDMHPSFSPDGSRLVYSSISARSGQWELWVVTLATREKKMIGHGLFPSWSPEKGVDRIAFQRARQRGSRWFSLWTLDLADGEARRITEVAVSSNAAIISPCWSPDGKRLAFATVVDPAQTNKGKPRGQQDIWVIDADGGNRQRLTDGTATCLIPCWSTDHRVYFVSDRDGRENVWSVRTDPASVWPVAAGHGKETPAAAPAAAASAPTGKTAVGSTAPELER
jgi:Tol biopolymer transport system component